jgi:peptidoglycan lytic transglycosylase G
MNRMPSPRRNSASRLRFALLSVLLAACSAPSGPPVEITIPVGATFQDVLDTLSARGIVGAPARFRAYVRLRGADRSMKSGRYSLRPGQDWSSIVQALTEGRVLTAPMTIPEGFRLAQMAKPISGITGLSQDTVLAALGDSSEVERWGVPGPSLEGYLFPDTYRFAPGIPLDTVVAQMVRRYRTAWTTERRARLDTLGMSENEVITLASIIQAEARHVEEMPRISSVYHGRLKRGMLLQADPTVIYALGGYRARLLFAAIDSVAESPYNTYTQPGLPPGPIGAPGDAAIQAALYPADEPYLYFVARPDGTHIFSRSLIEHNRAVGVARRERDALDEGP